MARCCYNLGHFVCYYKICLVGFTKWDIFLAKQVLYFFFISFFLFSFLFWFLFFCEGLFFLLFWISHHNSSKSLYSTERSTKMKQIHKHNNVAKRKVKEISLLPPCNWLKLFVRTSMVRIWVTPYMSYESTLLGATIGILRFFVKNVLSWLYKLVP